MNAPGHPSALQILSAVMHHIDSKKKSIQHVPINISAVDLNGYLDKLLSEIRDQENKRVYSPASATSEFSTCLSDFKINPILENNSHSTTLARRLVREEFESINRHPNLNPIAKGSFLQFTYQDGTTLKYLGVKVEHSTFIDINTLIRAAGLADDRKLYKAVMVELSQAANNNIYVYDTNGKPAAYWWKNFLELDVQRNDSENTKNAVDAVIKTLGLLKSEFPADHSLLRNSAIAAFKQKSVMRYGEFVDNLLSTYDPVDAAAKNKISTIEQKLRQLPATKNFDTQFMLDPAAVPYRQRKITLSPEITLTIKEGIEKLDEKIWASKTQDGRNILVIQTEHVNGFEFKR